MESKNEEQESDETKESCLAFCWRYFVAFSEITSIHGMRYLGEPGLPRIERIFWTIVVLVPMIACLYLMTNLYAKWKESPVLVSSNEKSLPAWQIPFPAVTICPEAKNNVDQFNFTDIYLSYVEKNSTELFTTEQRKNFETLSEVCDPYLFEDITFDSKMKIGEASFRLFNMSIRLDQFIARCDFRTEKYECSDIFKKVITKIGICYTFNMLDQASIFSGQKSAKKTYWSRKNGYNTHDINIFPKRIMGRGASNGLSLVLVLNRTTQDFLCRGPIQGFRVLLHPPDEYPSVWNDFFNIPLGKTILVGLQSDMVETSESLRHYLPEKRQCHFEDELKLKFFKIYSQSNCELECLANYTLNMCGCVILSMPHKASTRICGLNDFKCRLEAQKFMSVMGLKNHFGAVNQTQDCNCLPACTTINYETQVTQTDFDHENFLKIYDIISQSKLSDPELRYSKLIIFSRSNDIIVLKRSELYGFTDFLAGCGGLFGLFAGISLISLVEMAFYLIVHPIFKRNPRTEENNEATAPDSSMPTPRISQEPKQ